MKSPNLTGKLTSEGEGLFDSSGRLASAVFLVASLALFGGMSHITGFLTSTAFTVAGVNLLWASVLSVLTVVLAISNSQFTSTGMPTAGALLLAAVLVTAFSPDVTSWISTTALRSLGVTAVLTGLFYATIEGKELGGMMNQ